MHKILIVDDHPINRQFLVKLLGYYGYQLFEAADGVEGLSLVHLHNPDLVITDIAMPHMDGGEFVRQLRQAAHFDRLPVLFYTASYRVAQARALGEGYGMVGVIHKPAKPKEVLDAVAKILGPPPVEPKPEELVRRPGSWPGLARASGGEGLMSDHLRLAALAELGLDLTMETETQQLLDKFCHGARYILDGLAAGVVIPDPEGQRGPFFALNHRQPLISAEAPQAGIFPQFLGSARSGRLKKPAVAPSRLGLPPDHPPLASLLAAAIPVSGLPQGSAWVFAIDKQKSAAFEAEDERLAVTLAAQLGVAFENVRLHTEALARAVDLEQEIQERKQTEERYRRVVEGSLHGIAIQQDGEVKFANPACARIFGYESPEEIVGLSWQALVDPEDWPVLVQRVDASVRGEAVPLHPGWRGIRKDGSRVWVESGATVIPWQERPAILSFMMDITERKKLEEQFRQAQKMEAIGRLAGGVAHDFNNLLTVIIGFSEIMLTKLFPGDPLKDLAAEIKKAGERAAGLTRQLLAFSRKQMLLPIPLNLNDHLKELEKMLRRLIGEDVDLKVTGDSNLWLVKADPGQIEQVIMNLVVNARDAMPQGGKVTIETHNVQTQDMDTARYPEIQPGPHVLLAVSDTGCGMDKATQARIFEPFFSTKGEKGTGLGLATVYGIVKQSGGHIQVYSEPGAGTTFKIYLPREQEMAPIRKSAQGVLPAVRASETILLAEDEEGVRSLTRMVLLGQGYKVIEAKNGGEALILCEQYQDPIHLLLTDVVMPKMSGRQVAERLTRLRPDMRVLFLSGYTDDAIVHHGVLDPETPFLQKPFTGQTLLRKVRAVLDWVAVE